MKILIFNKNLYLPTSANSERGIEITDEQLAGLRARTHRISDDLKSVVEKTSAELLADKQNALRARREKECFPIVNRGQLWYEKLSQEEKAELDTWYTDWLNVTDTLIIPDKPLWIK